MLCLYYHSAAEASILSLPVSNQHMVVPMLVISDQLQRYTGGTTTGVQQQLISTEMLVHTKTTLVSKGIQ